MDAKSLIIVSSVLACLLIILGIEIAMEKEATSDWVSEEQRRPLSSIEKAEAVAKIVLKQPTSTFTLIRKELEGIAYFAIAEREDYPADGTVVHRLLHSVLNVTLIRKHGSDDRMAEACGLKQGESTSISLFDAQDRLLGKLHIGKKIASGRFVRIGDEKDIFVTRAGIEVPLELRELASFQFPKISPQQIESVYFSFPREHPDGSLMYVIGRGAEDESLVFSDENARADDFAGMICFLNDFSIARFCDVSYEAAGLNKPVEVVEFNLKGGSRAVISIGDLIPPENDREEMRRRYVSFDFKLGNDVPVELKPHYIEFRMRSGKHVFLLEDSREFALMDFTAPLLPGLEIAKLKEIELARKEDRVVLKREGEKWLVAEGYDFPAEEGRVDSFLSSLKDIRARPGDIGNDSVPLEKYADTEEGNTTIVLKDAQGTITLTICKERKAEGSLFLESDFCDFSEFIAMLADRRRPVSCHLLEKMNPKIQTEVKNSADFRKALIQELNRVVREDQLYKKDVFQGISLSEECLEMLQGRGDPLRLNRLLIEDAYPGQIVRSEKYLISDVAEISDNYGNYYIKPSGRLTLGSSGPTWVPLAPVSWLNKEVLQLSESEVASIEIGIAGMELSWNSEGDKVVASKEPEGFPPVDTASLLNALAFLKIADVVKKTEEDLYNNISGQPESLRVKVVDKKGLTVVISLKGMDASGYRFGTIVASSAKVEGEESDIRAQQINERFRDRIVRLDPEIAKNLFALPLKKKEYRDISAITLSSGGESVELKKEGGAWRIGQRYADEEKIAEFLTQVGELPLRYGNYATGTADDVTVSIMGQSTDVYRLGKPFEPEGKRGFSYRFLETAGNLYLIREDDLDVALDFDHWLDHRLLRLRTTDVSAVKFKYLAKNISHDFIVEDGKIKFADLAPGHVMLSPLEQALDGFFKETTEDKMEEKKDARLVNEFSLSLKDGGEVTVRFSDFSAGEVYLIIEASGTPLAADLHILQDKVVKEHCWNLERFAKKREDLESLEVHTSRIFVSLKGRSEQEARQRIEEVKKKLTEPEADFATLAKEYSDEPNARETGGKYATPIRANSGDVESEYKDAALKLDKPGALSEPVRTKKGFYIIRRDD